MRMRRFHPAVPVASEALQQVDGGRDHGDERADAPERRHALVLAGGEVDRKFRQYGPIEASADCVPISRP